MELIKVKSVEVDCECGKKHYIKTIVNRDTRDVVERSVHCEELDIKYFHDQA